MAKYILTKLIFEKAVLLLIIYLTLISLGFRIALGHLACDVWDLGVQ